jgi:hypothetical protein
LSFLKYHKAPDQKTGKSSAAKTVFFQPKLSINQPGDVYEQEANTMADKLMQPGMQLKTLPANPLQKKCTHCEQEEKQLQRKENNENDITGNNAAAYIGRLNGGQTLPAELQNFYEPKFGFDFSNVKIHTDTAAAKSAQSINALAYTSGNNIVFGSGQFSPLTTQGKKLLGHELTHVVQQNAGRAQNSIQRFSDTDHHIVEEVALKDLFNEKEIGFIEHGNMQRDYSQLPAGAIPLLVRGANFGPYSKTEHFDNFIFDTQKDRWVSHAEYEKIWDDKTKEWVKRTAPALGKGKPKTTPLQYIETELLAAVQKNMPDESAFIHVGNAFHTIEDFFAHSNFIELTQGDYTHGKELTTHLSGVAGSPSEDFILESISDPASAAFFTNKITKQREKSSALSHGIMAKDFHSNKNHAAALTLSVLVIRETATQLKAAFALPDVAQRKTYVRDTILKTLSGYFRPPSPKDKWWENMLTADNGNTARRIKALQDKTPVTVNQLPGSPLRNFEATRFSSWKAIGLGTSVSLQLKDRTFFTAGYMLYAPDTGKQLSDDKIFVAPRSAWDQNDRPAIILGAQVSGTFDLTDLLKK